MEWKHVEIFWGDERCVPPDHQESNYRMARDALLDRTPMSEARVHRIHGEDDPAAAAVAYERELRTAFATPAGPPRHGPGSHFDLVLLGIGEDGHTASLFPRSAALRENEHWVVAAQDAGSMWRITLTPPVINAADEVIFLVTGMKKAAILRRVIDGPGEPELIPALVVAPRAGRLRWMMDAEAAIDLH